MQLTDKIEELIRLANHRIDYIKMHSFKNSTRYPADDIWSIGYDKGYIAGFQKYIDDLSYLKKIIIEINKDDDDV